MAVRRCPECGVSVNLENLKRHLTKVHPGHAAPSAEFVERETRALRQSARRPRGSNSSWRWVVAIGIIVALSAGLVAAWPRMAGSGGGMNHGGMDGMMHIHPVLHITINGQPATIPANIGIDSTLWNDHSLDTYGMMSSMAPLHTHDSSGTIHVESAVIRDYTIGEFFRVWGESFDGQQVVGHVAGPGHSVWMLVDGSRTTASSSLVLRDAMTIEIVCGPS